MTRISIAMSKIESRLLRPSVDDSLKVGWRGSLLASYDGSIPFHNLDARLGFIGQLLILARQKVSWSPALIASELWRFLTNTGAYREILTTLKLRPFKKIAQNNPRLALKYVAPNYLARGFTVSERASCFLHHYRRLHAALPESVLCQMMLADITLHDISNDVDKFAITLGLPELHFDLEGELSLNLQVDGKKVFNLSFTIVPGWVLKSKTAEALLISRLQGNPGCNSQIRRARKALNDYSPRNLLLAALQGIADALGVSEIAAVSATNQKSYINGRPVSFKNGYDTFLTKAGMVKTSFGFFSSQIPIQGKPLSLFKGRARSRAKKRRAIRQQIRLACAHFLLEAIGRSSSFTSCSACLAASPAAAELELSPVSSSTPDYNRVL